MALNAREPIVADDVAAFHEFMLVGNPGWFGTLVECLCDIHGRHLLAIADDLVLADLVADGWRDLSEMPKLVALRWIRCARIELDHLFVEERVREIIEARCLGDSGLLKILVAAFPVDIELRAELTVTMRRVWVRTAKLAARGRCRRVVPVIYPGYGKANKVENATIEDEVLLERDRGLRIEAACDTKRQIRGGIYFVTADHEHVKIGYATDVAARVRTLQTSVPQPLHILLVIAGSLADERVAHRRFATDHLRGEWFRLSSGLREFIEAERSRQRSKS